LTFYIVENNFDEVILVDFPGFNLMLAKKLKRLRPDLKIIYLSPPQLWVWGAWRVKKLKRYCNEVIVLYPFEVAWYKSRGVTAKWLGYPFYNEFEPYFELSEQKENKIAILPGSRVSETVSLLPYFVQVIKLLKKRYKDLKFVLPLAESFSKDFLEREFKKLGLDDWEASIEIVVDQELKTRALSQCALAISKPGTATLQLGLLKVPTIIIYKTSWLTYLIAKSVARVKYMGLSNLLLGREICSELIQKKCSPEEIFKKTSEIYEQFLSNDSFYVKNLKNLSELRKMLKAPRGL
ncbi:hypothetical protein KAW80_04655, partial [Candidatus Babeliales bacterium]|nr:hypothetical protein [Candidatus Babeliales bacterium]